MDFSNRTALDSQRLFELFDRFSAPYDHGELTVSVRDSRGAAFSGACYYASARLTINLSPRNRYPFVLATHAAKATTTTRGWQRELLRLSVADAYQLALFIYLHELYHYLVKTAGRSPRRKEGMCDRFATRVLVDAFGCALRGTDGRIVERDAWDFQDLHGFVRSAPRVAAAPVPRREIPVRILA